MVGILLPSTVAGSLVNIAVLLAGKVPVNLNFTAGSESMASAVSQCKIKTIITSRLFLSKANLAEMPGMVFVEDMRKNFYRHAKVSDRRQGFSVAGELAKPPLPESNSARAISPR